MTYRPSKSRFHSDSFQNFGLPRLASRMRHFRTVLSAPRFRLTSGLEGKRGDSIADHALAQILAHMHGRLFVVSLAWKCANRYFAGKSTASTQLQFLSSR